ncbi:hypothetical protein Nepgr_014763 [Nepenthes gracilis]|uniref:Uncharacterized protein n=1 Tax=Nepenthes gracilis TaxID=150966 RepID=A0AAD3SKM7_NEPGR|nr:hypothetical protein Nepgr_014763 [Nepenthes gracilis]
MSCPVLLRCGYLPRAVGFKGSVSGDGKLVVVFSVLRSSVTSILNVAMCCRFVLLGADVFPGALSGLQLLLQLQLEMLMDIAHSPLKKGGPGKSLNKKAPQYKPSGRFIPKTLVVNDQGGKSPRNSKRNSDPLMKDVSAVPDSNSFAALQSSEADFLHTLSEGSGITDVNLLAELAPVSNLGDETDDPECLPLPDKEAEPQGEFPMNFETSGLARGSRI